MLFHANKGTLRNGFYEFFFWTEAAKLNHLKKTNWSCKSARRRHPSGRHCPHRLPPDPFHTQAQCCAPRPPRGSRRGSPPRGSRRWLLRRGLRWWVLGWGRRFSGRCGAVQSRCRRGWRASSPTPPATAARKRRRTQRLRAGRRTRGMPPPRSCPLPFVPRTATRCAPSLQLDQHWVVLCSIN